MSICLTFDVEAWPVPADFGVECGSDTSGLACSGLSRVLDLLRRHGVHATFFLCGDAMPDAAKLVRRALREGHELAVHGKEHKNYMPRPQSEFIEETTQLVRSIRDAFGVIPVGFRAPRFRVNKNILLSLQKMRFLYDSSIHPTYVPNNYNYLRFPSKPFKILPRLMELPVSTGLFRVPISWWWFRNLGRGWSSANVRWLLGLEQNVVLYFHPWEFVRMPVLDGVPAHIYRNTGERFLEELEKFIVSFKSSGFTALRYLLVPSPRC